MTSRTEYWQQVYYAELDGQRPKRVVVKAMGG